MPHFDSTDWDVVPAYVEAQDLRLLEAWTEKLDAEVSTLAHGTLGLRSGDVWDSQSLRAAERYFTQDEERALALREVFTKYLGEGMRRAVDGQWVCLPTAVDLAGGVGLRPARSWPWQYLIPVTPLLDVALEKLSGTVWADELASIRSDGPAWLPLGCQSL
ncbi:hypothetical protein [Gordonia crocea]|uniref:Uncharacterized protein n=1 Tax=Gordonia crocea TaxID=589162 RepID=A0A7I9UXS0_9ACTN|nr:hypothetical protein [Gordonia crocea]GED97709.1 hypothetical protein nbrc107697_17480 [Gordonia crocea]